MNTVRYGHTASTLINGKVLVTGGYNGVRYFSSTELYDPLREKWTIVTNMTTPRYQHTASMLPRGEILVAGGFNNLSLVTTEVYSNYCL